MALTCTVDNLKKNPSSIINQVKASKEPVYIEQSGNASVLLVDADTYLTDMQALNEFQRIYCSDVKGKPLDSALAANA
jgi:PHD/YefM family antitoxin component YafN of YafNO toxin-antitoxin module